MSKRRTRSAVIHGRTWHQAQNSADEPAQTGERERSVFERQVDSISCEIRQIERQGWRARRWEYGPEYDHAMACRNRWLSRIRIRIEELAEAVFAALVQGAGLETRPHAVDRLRCLYLQFNGLPGSKRLSMDERFADHVAAVPCAELLGVIRPAHRTLLSDHSDFLAWHLDLAFEPWCPPEGRKLTRRQTSGWRPLVNPSNRNAAIRGRPSIGEVEVVRRLRAVGFTAAAWTDGFGGTPNQWSKWSRRRRALPASLRQLDARIRTGIPDLLRDTKNVWPDIIAYRSVRAINDAAHAVRTGELIFVGYKGPCLAAPRMVNTISRKQELWVKAAVDRGLIPLSSYIVARWLPSAEARSVLERQWAMCEKPPRRRLADGLR